MDRQARSRMLIGEQALDRLRRSRVAVFGLGGVGGYAAEGLARSGVGRLTLVDGDVVTDSNFNRQIIALEGGLGRPKAELMEERLRQIDPGILTEALVRFYAPDTASQIDLAGFDYVLDCVDMVAAKVELAVRAKAAGTPLISAMGAGNKLDPGQLTLCDISQTSVCPLARVMRRLLRRRGVEHLQVVYSRELPRRPLAAHEQGEEEADREARRAPGSMVFVPAAMGMMMAAAVVRELAGIQGS